jgi:hypothetical protein
MSKNNALCLVLVLSITGCASPTIILKSGKTWQVSKDVKSVSCIVVGEDGVKYPSRCKLNAGDLVLPAGSIK